MKNKNNDDSKMLHFSFKLGNVSNFDIIKQIRNFKEQGYNSQSDLLRDAVMKFFDDDSAANNLKEEMDKEKLQSYKNKNELHTLEKRNRDALTRINEYHADNLDTVGSSPSPMAKRAMEHYVNKTKPYDEKAIYCPDCTWHTNSKDSIPWQINRITDHVKSSHNRSFTEDEAKIISELLV